MIHGMKKNKAAEKAWECRYSGGKFVLSNRVVTREHRKVQFDLSFEEAGISDI